MVEGVATELVVDQGTVSIIENFQPGEFCTEEWYDQTYILETKLWLLFGEEIGRGQRRCRETTQETAVVIQMIQDSEWMDSRDI